MTPSRVPWAKVAIIAVFALGIALFFALGGPRHLSLDAIQSNRDALLAFALLGVLALVPVAWKRWKAPERSA
jgi:hypothetical protein